MIHGHDMRRTFALLTGATLLYGIVAALTVLFASKGNGIATVWPANGVLVAMLLAQARPQWRTILPAALIGNVGAGLLVQVPLADSTLYGMVNLVEIGVAAALLRAALGTNALLGSPVTVGRFILIAGFVAPCVSATGGALVTTLMLGQDFVSSFRIWAWSDGLGLLIFTPIFYALFNGDFSRALRAQSRNEWAEMLCLLALSLLVSGYVFSTPFPLLFMLFPTVILIAFRSGRLGTEIAVVLIAATGAVLTGAGQGPLVAMTSDAALQAHLLQGVLAVLLLTGLPVAAALSARGEHIDALAAQGRLLARQAATDELTGFLNRSGFRDRASETLAVASALPTCLVAIDLDHFKTVNDRWGHHTGDRALAHMAQVLRGQLRGQDVIGRTGGDEFMLLLPSTDLNEAERVCSRMRDALRRSPLAVDSGSVALLSISCGVALAQADETIETLARAADRALYAAKSDGRNMVRRAS